MFVPMTDFKCTGNRLKPKKKKKIDLKKMRKSGK